MKFPSSRKPSLCWEGGDTLGNLPTLLASPGTTHLFFGLRHCKAVCGNTTRLCTILSIPISWDLTVRLCPPSPTNCRLAWPSMAMSLQVVTVLLEEPELCLQISHPKHCISYAFTTFYLGEEGGCHNQYTVSVVLINRF